MAMKLSGMYKAEVIDTEDALGKNRVKIRVKGLMHGIPEKYLPWAEYRSVMPTAAGGASMTPEVGSKVYAIFLGGDINDPVYFGGPVESENDLPKNADKDRVVLYESEAGSAILAVHRGDYEIEFKSAKYNTTLDTIIDMLLAHGHQYVSPVGPVITSVPTLEGIPANPPEIAYTDRNFKNGSLE